MSLTHIQKGAEVIYQEVTFRVRAVEGNVLALEASDGSFARFAHVSSVTVCEPPAAETTSLNLPVADVGQEASTTFCMTEYGGYVVSLIEFPSAQDLCDYLDAAREFVPGRANLTTERGANGAYVSFRERR